MTQPAAISGRMDGRLHRLPVRIYYEDTDFSGLVYHANFLRYFERGRTDFLRLAGISHSELLEAESPTAFTITEINVKFTKSARIDDLLEVVTAYDDIRGPRLVISQRMLRDEEEIARATVEACCISLTGRPKKPPPLIMERLKPFLER
jgi:acyl-CoA thioester hydrolase